MVNLHGQMEAHTRDSSMITISRELDCTGGQMDDSIMEIGSIIKCMEREYLLGMMAEGMKGSTMMIRNREKERFIGLMEESTLEVGTMENSTVLEST